MTEKQRNITWHRAFDGSAKIIIGTRSSIFLPFAKLGLICVDEEHESSYKQHEGFKYCGRDLAILRASMAHIPVVLGSATPSFKSLYQSQDGKLKALALPHKANGQDSNPITLIDVRHKKLDAGLSAQLLESMRQHLERGEQVLLFLNRRGFSPTLFCADCQWMAECHACDARLNYHQSLNALLCHHCQNRCQKPEVCPQCQSSNLCLLGQGTERLESVLKERFPHYGIVRLDTDSTAKKGELEEKLKQIAQQKASIILGTQMLSKGHDFPHVTLAAILDVEGGLLSSDFRAIERMGQTIVQVAGRAGRAQHPGQVILQSMQPEHPLLQCLLHQGYISFAETVLAERKLLGLPPYQHLAALNVSAPQLEAALAFLEQLKKQLPPQVQIIGPLAANMQKRLGRFRAALLFQSPDRGRLHPLLHALRQQLQQIKIPKGLRWDIDVDPQQAL